MTMGAIGIVIIPQSYLKNVLRMAGSPDQGKAALYI